MFPWPGSVLSLPSKGFYCSQTKHKNTFPAVCDNYQSVDLLLLLHAGHLHLVQGDLHLVLGVHVHLILGVHHHLVLGLQLHVVLDVQLNLVLGLQLLVVLGVHLHLVQGAHHHVLGLQLHLVLGVYIHLVAPVPCLHVLVRQQGGEGDGGQWVV